MGMTSAVRAIAAAMCAVAAALAGGCGKTESASASAAASAAVAVAVAAPAATAALGADLPAKLCAILRQKAPELKGMPEIGARVQLVMAIGTGFDANAAALQTVSSDIDAIAATSCPEVREPLLAATKAASLQEAVR